MRLGKTIIAWGIVAALGYAGGLWIARAGIDAKDASAILKGCAGVFTAATFSLGIIFRIVETAPPKELDDERQNRWTNQLSARWRLLWGRWAILLVATLVSSLSFLALDDKLSLISTKSAIALGSASLTVGLVATILSIHEIFHIRKTIQEVNSTLKDRKKRQDTLNMLEGPRTESEKPSRA